MTWLLVAVAVVVIIALGVYAGLLLSKLRAQNERVNVARHKRIKNINESIQTISFAMMQQQCNLSEGSIRICRILESVPVQPQPDYSAEYPAIHRLFGYVKNLPTHEERSSLSKKELRAQDKAREQQESELESEILKEVEKLRHFEAA